jgi:hypothetical protein
MIEYGWATYPSTNLSSGLLLLAHVVILSGLLFKDQKGVTVPTLSQNKLKRK